jgi:hypothetical protein
MRVLNDLIIAGSYAVGVQSVAYASSITVDPRLGGYVVVGTLSDVLLVNAPSYNATGMRLAFQITQGAGAFTGAVTWNAVFKVRTSMPVVASAMAVYEFVYDGTNWVQVDLGALNLLTTRGDLLVRNASNVTARLAIGSSGKVLHSDGTDVSWQSLVAADLPNTAVSAGSYTYSSITVDAQGRLTAASSGVSTTTADLEFVIDGGGSTINTGTKGYLIADFACTLQSVTLLGDASGSITVDVKKSTYSGFPTTSSMANAGTKANLSSAQKSQDTTLTSWTTSISAGDVIEFNVSVASVTVTRVTVVLKVLRT